MKHATKSGWIGAAFDHLLKQNRITTPCYAESAIVRYRDVGLCVTRFDLASGFTCVFDATGRLVAAGRTQPDGEAHPPKP